LVKDRALSKLIDEIGLQYYFGEGQHEEQKTPLGSIFWKAEEEGLFIPTWHAARPLTN